MSLPLHDLAGRWAGNSHLYLSWLPQPEHMCGSHLAASVVAGGNFLQLDYDWRHEGRPHEGRILIGIDPDTGAATGAFIDSWHQSRSIMALRGEARDGRIEVSGTYPAPPGPDWGWKIRIGRGAGGTLDITMINVEPDGKEDLAVRAHYHRVVARDAARGGQGGVL